MKSSKQIPLWVAFVADFVAFALLFGVFMLVHYVGGQLDKAVEPLGSLGTMAQNGNLPEGKPNTTLPSWMTSSDGSGTQNPSTPVLDTSGDFGKNFPERFLQTTESYLFEDDSTIRTYLNYMGYTYDDFGGDGRFVGLYHSHNICMTVMEVNTKITSLSSGSQHKERILVYDVYVRNIENLYTYAVGSRDDFESLVEEAESQLDFTVGLPIAAINGDYWGNTRHCFLAERNGSIIANQKNYQYIEADLCVLYYDGRVETLTPESYRQVGWETIKAQNPYQIWNFGPALLDSDGNPYASYSNQSYDHNVVGDRHPRSCFGYEQPGHYYFVTIDGRSDDSDGMTIPETARVMQYLGCKQAYNMDGGDSTYAYFNGEILRQNESRAENGNARKIYDILCIGEVR